MVYFKQGMEWNGSDNIFGSFDFIRWVNIGDRENGERDGFEIQSSFPTKNELGILALPLCNVNMFMLCNESEYGQAVL